MPAFQFSFHVSFLRFHSPEAGEAHVLSTRNAYILLPPGMGGHRKRHPTRICVVRTYKTHSNPSVFSEQYKKRFYRTATHRSVTHPAGVFRTSLLRKGLYVQNPAFREPC